MIPCWEKVRFSFVSVWNLSAYLIFHFNVAEVDMSTIDITAITRKCDHDEIISLLEMVWDYSQCSFDCFFFPSLSFNSTSTSSLSPSVLSSFLLFLVLYWFVLTSPFSFVGCRMCNKLRKQDKIYSNSSFIATKQSELSTGHGSTIDAKGNA